MESETGLAVGSMANYSHGSVILSSLPCTLFLEDNTDNDESLPLTPTSALFIEIVSSFTFTNINVNYTKYEK